LFGRVNPMGRLLRISGKSFQVIGIYLNPENIFQPPSQEIAAIIPFEAARRFFRYDETNALWIVVKPNDGISVSRAMDEVTVQLRRIRGLRAGDPNSFDLITQDQILDVFNKLTGVFFLVMLVLSSVALLVGGIGVMAIMMVSVTDRTREIGVRKALGATRREILWQFLVEAATLTLLGGVLGIVLGLAFGQLLRVFMSLELSVPVWSAVVACAVSVFIGLVFVAYVYIWRKGGFDWGAGEIAPNEAEEVVGRERALFTRGEQEVAKPPDVNEWQGAGRAG